MRRLLSVLLVLNAVAAEHILRIVHHKRRVNATGRKLQLRAAGARRVELDAAKRAQLNELNAMVAEYETAIDLSSRECAALRAEAVRDQLGRNDPYPVAPGTAVIRARRDITADQMVLSDLHEAALDQHPAFSDHAQMCHDQALRGQQQLEKLQTELKTMHDEGIPAGASGEAKDRWATALGSVADRVADLEDSLAESAAACKDVSAEMEQDMTRVRLTQGRIDVLLAHSTVLLNEATGKAHFAKEQHFVAMQREDAARKCTKKLDALHAQICGVRRTRQDLLAATGTTVRDCEVSDWVPTPCSTSCGGGQRSLIRRVIAEADGGAPCPSLTEQEDCNTQSCELLDCVMSEWSAWSACDHVETRVRSVLTHPTEGGTPCGMVSETRMCGVGDEAVCTLGEWSSWSGCSRACGGGVKIRNRGVSTACSKSTPTEAQEICNRQACDAGLRCASEDKILFVLDGSGSVKDTGFAALKELLASVVARVPEAAVLLAGDEITPVAMFGPGSDAVSAVEGASFPGSITTIPEALGHASSMGAQVVVVLTDGEPNSAHMMRDASYQVRETARLVFVTSGTHSVSEYASSPTRDNVMVLDPFSYRDEAADLLITMLCSKLES
jgi:hypothetical protein